MNEDKIHEGFHTLESEDYGWKPGMRPIYFKIVDDNGQVVNDPEVIKAMHDKMMNSGKKFKKLLEKYVDDKMKKTKKKK
jgi:hypothetical protein